MGSVAGADHLQAGNRGENLQGVGLYSCDTSGRAGVPGLTGGGQSGQLGGGLGTGTQAVFLSASQQQGLQVQALADVLGADAFGRPDLVAADGEQIHPQLLGSEGDL